MSTVGRRSAVMAGLAAAALGLAGSAAADGLEGQCRVIKTSVTPAAAEFQPQIVMWLEKPDGTYVDTTYITQMTGRYGLGNRPGRMDFNSGPKWPYGRRISTFPVWAHRNQQSFPVVRFQKFNHVCCSSEDDLSHDRELSSTETFFCAPRHTDAYPVDAITCASATFTDKGVVSTDTTGYPPRLDITTLANEDSSTVSDYQHMNTFDAVSQATSPGDMPLETTFPAAELPAGDYVLFVEVSREFDQNATYSADAYPGPDVLYHEYGAPYRGQPSLIYKVPIHVGVAASTGSVLDYLGYGDPDGLTGDIHAPDATITTDVIGSGANRLRVATDGASAYRVKVEVTPQVDMQPPSGIIRPEIAAATTSGATLTFVATGDDFRHGKAAKYELRTRVDGPVTDDNFATSTPVSASVTPLDAGELETVELTGLLPSTTYSLGIRAVDDCGLKSPLSVVSFTTADRESGQVDACFIATAAYGSIMAQDVSMLRHFRDEALRHSVLGEMFVESYYTFGPPVAGVVGESEILRATARALLQPIVHRVRGL